MSENAVSFLCIGCGICSKVCPKDNIRLVDGKPQFVARTASNA